VIAALLLAAGLVAATPASLIPPGRGAKRAAAADSPLVTSGPVIGGRRPGTAAVPYLPTRVSLRPSPAKLGQRLAYRGSVLVPSGTRVRFDRPAPGGVLTWGTPRTGQTSVDSNHLPMLDGGVDSAWVDVPLQVFTTGLVAVPGVAVELRTADGRRLVRRLPTAHVVVLPTLTAADSNATLRALHGPFGAPWWERVPWPLVIGGLLVLAAGIGAIVLARRRRRPAAAAAPAVPAPVPARDPAADALAALAKLRALRLPQAGRFADHAFELTRILRRYLEAVMGTPRPGDTSGELVERLRHTRLGPEEVARLEGLLGLWDRVKFARAPLGLEEAERCEAAVEALVRRRDVREVA
jgi:hypothetical protein